MSKKDTSKGKSSAGELKSQFKDFQQRLGKKSDQSQSSQDPATTRSKRDSLNSGARPLSGVDFLSDLSDGLLIESRRLNHENQQLKTQLSELEEKYNQSTKQLSNLQVLSKKLGEKEQTSGDKIWELETEIRTLRENAVKYQQLYEKSSKDKASKDSELETLKSQLEAAQENSLINEKQTASKILQLNNTIKELKQRNSELNDENDDLHQKVQNLSTKEPKRVSLPPVNNENLEHDTFDESSFMDPSLSPVRQVHNNSRLESETLASSLQKAQKTISKLKQNLVKTKAERDTLERKLAGDSPKSAVFKTPSKRLSAAESVGWEDYDKSSEIAPKDSEYSNMQVLGEELGNLSDEYDEMETSQIRYLENYASQHGMRLVPALTEKSPNKPIIDVSTGFDIVALPNDKNVHSPIEQLKTKCLEYDLVPVSKKDYEQMVKRSNYEEIDESKLKDSSLKILPLLEYKVLESKADKADSAETELGKLKADLESKSKEHEQNINSLKKSLQAAQTKLDSPDVSYIKELAGKHNLVLLTTAENESIKSLSTPRSSPVKRGADLGSPTKRNGPSVTDGTVEIAASTLRSLQQTVDNPTITFLSNKLTKLGYKALPVNEYEILVAKSSSNGVNVSPRKQKALESAETVESLKKRCADRGLVVLSKSSYESILVSSKRSLTSVELMERVEKSGMVALKKGDYDGLLETIEIFGPQFEETVEKMKRSGPQHINSSVNELRSLADQQSKITTSYESPSVSYLTQKARDAGYHLLNEKEFKAKKVEPTLDDCRKIAKKNDHVLLESKEHEELVSHKEKSSKPSHEYVSKLAAVAGLTVLGAGEAKKLSRPSKSQLTEFAKQQSLVLVDQNEYGKLKSTSDQVAELAPRLKELESKNKQLQSELQSPDTQYLISAAEKSGHVLIPVDQNNKTQKQLEKLDSLVKEVTKLKAEVQEKTEKIKKTQTAGYVKSQASKHSLIAIPVADKQKLEAQLEQVQKQLSDKDNELKSKDKALQDSSRQVKDMKGQLDASKRASISLGAAKSVITKNGLVCLTKSEVDALKAKRESVYEDASEKLETSVVSKADLERRASELGFVVLPWDSKSGDKSATDVDKLKKIAKNLGLETIEPSKLEQLQRPKEAKVDTTKLRELAKNLGVEVVDPKAAPNKSDVQKSASRLGLKLLSSSEIESLKKRPISSQDLANKAAELKLKLVPEDEEPKTDLRQLSKEKGYMLIPESKFIATTVSRTVDESNVVVLPSTYYNKLIRSHGWYKNHKTEIEGLEKHVGGEGDEPSVFSAEVVKTPPAQINLARHATKTSLHTSASLGFSNQEMIAAITQTIIGEYLFKYYRKLGPLSSLSETRHERYFWIHPYSLTLYWSATNPILGDPSENKIRALAISSVESVDDSNPLPPGLFHKSIIVHSTERSIKITCQSQKRHNIWFNSLKYLIERSLDENLNFDAENQYDVSFAVDDRVEHERAAHGHPVMSSKNLTTKGLFNSLMTK